MNTITNIIVTPSNNNPDQIIMNDGPHCKVHNWTPGEVYKTVRRMRKIEGAKDDNGFCIYVMSNRTNEPVWLSDIEYSLIKEK